MNKRTSLIEILADGALIACGVLAAVCVVPTAFDAPFLLKNLILIALPMALLISAGLHLSDRGWLLPAVLFAGAAAVYGFARRAEIARGANLLWYSAARLLSLDFSFLPTPAEPEAVLIPEVFVTEFLVFAAALLTLLIGILVIKSRSPIPAVIAPVPPFILGFIYTDCSPALFTVALLVIYWGGVLFGQDRKKRARERAGVGKAIFILLLAAVALLITYVSPEGKFTPIPFSERRGLFDTVGSVRDNLRSHRLENPTEVNLVSEGERRNDLDTAFSFSCSREGALYLRSHSYGLYSMNKWAAAKEYPGAWNSMMALASTQNGTTRALRIRGADSSERLVPYAFMPGYDIFVGESFIRANGRTAYVWNYLDDIEFSPQDDNTYEDEYYRFALQQYTLPNGATRDELIRLLDTYVMPAGESMTPYSQKLRSLDPYTAARYLASVISSKYKYDLFPGKVPYDQDFIEYFVTQTHKGYCVHFASATTAFLQAVGVPARYVVGYRVYADAANMWTDAKKMDSHAWTEVYVKGIGWLPIESTAGLSANIGFDPDKPLPTPTPQNTYSPENTLPPPPGSDEPMETARPSRSPRVAPTGTPAPTAKPGHGGNTGKRFNAKLWLPIMLLAAILIWQGAGVIIRARRKRAFEQEDSRAAVLAMIEYLGSVRRYGAPSVKDAETLEKEAAFSNHPMKDKQKELLEMVEDTRFSLCRHSPLMRFVIKWITFRI